MGKKETEMITLNQVHEVTKIPLRTLQHAAQVKKLRAVLKESPIGKYYETTWPDVESWRRLYYRPVKEV